MIGIRPDIEPAHLAIVRQALRDALPSDARVWVFGSRATGCARRTSDLDLAVDAGRPLTRRETSSLRNLFEESDLPYRVDVVDWHCAASGFREATEGDLLALVLIADEE